MNAPGNRTALVLSGGGAYGAFAVGIMKVLFAGRSPATEYQPLQSDIFAGTSVGAFNAAVMVGDTGESSLNAAHRLENIWIERVAERPGRCGNGIFRVRGDPSEYFGADCFDSPVSVATRLAQDSLVVGRYLLARTANFLAASGPLSTRAVGLVNVGAFVDSAPFHAILRDVVKEEDIFQSPKRLRITATNWSTGQLTYFGNADFVSDRGFQAVIASTAIPGVFPPVRIGRDLFVDGGIVENTPLTAAIELGGTEIHIVYLDPEPQFIPLLAEANTVDTLLRVYYLMLATKIKEDIKTARWINDGLKALQRFTESGDASPGAATDFIKIAGQIFTDQQRTFNVIKIHRYYPKSTLGDDFGMVDYQLSSIVKMIEEGERVALTHDCSESRCLI